jgi:SAM-dependent methyltransferase
MKSLGSLFLPAGLHERLQVERYPIIQFIRKEALPLMKAGVKVLDAGSGKKHEQQMRGELLATGAMLHTCDINEGPGVDFAADVSDLPFEDETYDIVLSTQVLEHVKDPAKVVQEMARVLKPGGHLFLTTPQSSPLHNLPWNFFNFTNLGLRLLFEQAGLVVEKEEAQGGHFILLAFMLHWTAREIDRRDITPLIKVPLMALTKFFFGFFFKIILIWLDRFDRKDPLNTLGWNFHVRKPALSDAAA